MQFLRARRGRMKASALGYRLAARLRQSHKRGSRAMFAAARRLDAQGE